MADTPNPSTNSAPAVDASLLNPLDSNNQGKAYSSDVLKNIVETETSTGADRILEAAPEVDTSLLEVVVEDKSIKLTVFKIAFGILLSLSLISILFFTSQLTNKLEFAGSVFNIPNISKRLAASNQEVLALQTDLNLYRYLELKAVLDKFSYDGDAFIHAYDIANSQTSSNEEKLVATNSLATQKTLLQESFLAAREIVAQPFEAPLIDPSITDLPQTFQQALKTKLTEKSKEIGVETDSGPSNGLKNYAQTMKLVGNQKLKTTLMGTDFAALTDRETYDLIKEINSLIVNDLSLIQEVKNKRVRWSDVMQEIEMKTIAVDRNYSENFYDQIGGIRYTSYDFDAKGPKISLVGEIKRFDTTNFTMISNLIDSLNDSEFFENGEMQSFSKSGSLDSGYTSTLRLILDLENATEADIAASALAESVETQTTN